MNTETHAQPAAAAHKSARQQWPEVIMNTYGTPSLELVSGRGSRVIDAQGREHIDMLAGIAVNSLGHGHPALIDAVTTQLNTLGHVSNLFASQPVVDVAETLIERYWGTTPTQQREETRVFFCNSGAEANEAALKIARLTGRGRILAAEHGFHGRTMGALAMTGQPDKRQPFSPLPQGVEFFPYGDLDYLEKLITINPTDVAMIILEPIQGETGVIPAPEGFLSGIAKLCATHSILFACDEVQTGIGRTGDFFGFHHENIRPDIVTMAKGLGGGLPIGAVLARGRAATLLSPGKHGTTFGGNPISCAAARAVLSIIDQPFLEEVKRKGELLTQLLGQSPHITQIRGRGLMLGVVLHAPVAKQAVAHAAEHGLILNAPNQHVIRLTPPLVITDEELAQAAHRLCALIDAVTNDATD
ncbi:MAG: acetylornithine transaminase [Corynebacterium sp.]|uniref:acetylornithine transaminase n=1 Tax=Corynebacterium sp. TaxID=1720 RepID=UPI0026DDC5A8|nr:acetylornithine transaminase [Corynebacterium sp.]MDO4761299.1 acetylornithine transaminase [Corynebacterium sp.]